MNVFPGEHFVTWHNMGDPLNVQIYRTTDRDEAERTFYMMARDNKTNWIKWHMIRHSDGKYLFERDYQTRT